MAFQEVLWKFYSTLSFPQWLRLNLTENKKPNFYHMSWFNGFRRTIDRTISNDTVRNFVFVNFALILT